MPGAPQYPWTILYDTDAVIQIIIGEYSQIFRDLESGFGVKSRMTSVVDFELRNNKKYKSRVVPYLDQLIRSKRLGILSAEEVKEISDKLGTIVTPQSIRAKACEYETVCGPGEASTHAAGVLLQIPVVSNDKRAYNGLSARAKALPPFVLHVFDLFVFSAHEGLLSKQVGERLRSNLTNAGEGIHPHFEKQSFETGCATFPRFVEAQNSVEIDIAASAGKLIFTRLPRSGELFRAETALPDVTSEK
jgi:hypothetical protein